MSKAKVTVAAQGDRELVITREFNATRDLVFEAYTECKYLKRWLLGPEGWTMPGCEIDLKVGGKYRWVWRKEKDGTEMGAGGEYREIERPAKLVATEKFDEAWYPGEAVSTVTFTENDGRTTLVNTMQYISKEARDMVMQSPMEEGLEVGFDRLDAMLTESAKAA
jgi:uncharacterized protein YndB with AHSA1/START domain